jgi:hypothetical protein
LPAHLVKKHERWRTEIHDASRLVLLSLKRAFARRGTAEESRRYLRKYEALCRDEVLRSCLPDIKPETPIIVTLHALII